MFTPDSPQVLRYWFASTSSAVAGSTRIVPTAGMVVNGWTSSKDKRMCLSMAAFAPAGTIIDPILPTVVNAAATDITFDSARLNGVVTDNGYEDPAVTIYWGTSDGVTTPGNWDYAEPLAAQNSTFSSDISSLSASTTYHFRAYAENSAGADWADSTESFTTDAAPSAPTVVNAAATNISFYSARLNGEVTDNGLEDPTVTVYWGESDGVETPDNWDNADIIGEQNSTFFDNIFALSASTTYHFRAYAENSAGVDWADSTASFTTDPGGGIYINFQPSGSPVPSGYLVDSGDAYGDRGNGQMYGWDTTVDETHDRDINPDQRYDTLIQMDNDVWEMEVANRDYVIDLVMGDPLSIPFVEYQAEDGTWNSGSKVDTKHAGYTGTGFVDTNNAVGTWFEVSVNTPYTGDYDITVRYANGSTDRPADVTVNSVPAISGLNFPSTGAWTTWSTVNFSLTLTSGTNAVRFTATSADGLGNTDRVDVEALPAYSINDVSIEGVVINDPDGGDNFDEYFGISVTVTDGKLTISPQGSAENAKICYIDITPAE